MFATTSTLINTRDRRDDDTDLSVGFLFWEIDYVLVAQMDRASVCEAEGCRFESCLTHQIK